ncbi:MAG: alginate export family protein [Planctomycetes bacterium]|nr:alginate export family protein [Planctomycetota bacterium]
MLSLSLIVLASQFDLSQIEFDTHVRVRAGHNSLADTASGTPGSSSAGGIHVHSMATMPLNDFASLTLAGHIYADNFDDETGVHFDMEAYFDADQLWGDSQLRIGRMGLEFGNGILISSNPWSFEENIHDAVLWQTNFFETDFDFFGSSAVTGEAAANNSQMIGVHGEYEIDSNGLLETYWFKHDKDNMGVREYNLALRLASRTSNGLNYDLMLMLQNGTDGPQEITSNAYLINLSKQLDFGHGVGVGLAVAQGDREGESVRESYAPVMIDYHKYNGRADILAFSNLMDFSFNYWLNWNERWAMHVDVHSFLRQSIADGVYFGNEAAMSAAANDDAEIAREIDFYLEGEISDNLNLDFGVSLFSPQGAIVHDKEQFIVFLQGEYSF